MLKCFNISRVGPELVPYIKMAKTGPIFELDFPLAISYSLTAGDLSQPQPSKLRIYLSYNHSYYYSILNSSTCFGETLRFSMELESKTLNLADAVIKGAERRGLTAGRSKINP